MNLKEVYEIFIRANVKKIHLCGMFPKIPFEKRFFEELLPMEIRWINCKIWNDKARRSRFFGL